MLERKDSLIMSKTIVNVVSHGKGERGEEFKKMIEKFKDIVNLDKRIYVICPEFDEILIDKIDLMVLGDKKQKKKVLRFFEALEKLRIIGRGTSEVVEMFCKQKNVTPNVKSEVICTDFYMEKGLDEKEFRKRADKQLREKLEKQAGDRVPQYVIDKALKKAIDNLWNDYKERCRS